MKKLFLSLLLVASCATTSPTDRRPDPRDQRREAQSASNTHGDFEPRALRDRPQCDHTACELR